MTTLPTISGKSWSRIVARAWADEAFKDRLLSDPKSVLREHGIEAEGAVSVSAAETDGDIDADESESRSIDETLYLILPAPPSDLSEEDLVPSGAAYCGCGGCHRCGRCGCGCGGCGGCGLCNLCA